MEEQQIIHEIAPKKSRHRKKLLYSALKDLMEFYFSDVNLSKDRFLGQLIQKDPYIDLSIFLQFNKVRHLTEKLSDLCKAISKSDTLLLSEDNLKVCRKTPIRCKENEDECTIYVERLPADTEHDWLKNAFSKFGPVDYVSIPRYKQNRMIKGFAFIEFATPETAKKALEYFESIDCKLPTSMLPDQLASISSFESEKSENILNKFSAEIKTTENKEFSQNIIKVKTPDSETKVKRIKRKDTDDCAETNEVKKIKLEQEMEINECKKSDEAVELQTIQGKKKKNEKQKATENEEQLNETVEVEESKKKKKKKAKKCSENEQLNETDEVEEMETTKKQKKKDSQETELDINVNLEETDNDKVEEINNDKPEETGEQEECTTEDVQEEKKKRKRKTCKKSSSDLQQYGLQVLSKKEWKQLRNKYLNLQRQKMQTLKEHLYRSRFTKNNLENNTADKNSSENSNNKSSGPRFEFTPGSIVHITLPDTFNDVKKLKSDIRSQAGLQYLDIQNGCNVGYIRFSDNNTAKKFCETGYINSDLCILEGSDEKEYWDKIIQNREEKFKKESKKTRGRDKLLRKAEKELGKHIKFENAE